MGLAKNDVRPLPEGSSRPRKTAADTMAIKAKLLEAHQQRAIGVNSRPDPHYKLSIDSWQKDPDDAIHSVQGLPPP